MADELLSGHQWSYWIK